MSVASYRKNVTKGFVRNRPVCLVAALEQISPNFGYKRQTYDGYEEFVNWYCSHTVKQRDDLIVDYEDAIKEVVKPLGGLSFEDIQFSRATTRIGFLRIMHSHLKESMGVTVDISRQGHTAHTVGILPVGQEIDHVTLVSTHIPKCLQGIVSLEKLSEHLYIPDCTAAPNHPLNNSNVMAIPIL